ncbi:MAG: hypothetical protein H8D23_17725 [Candidatus Brocadiales bacterium]|nr:hypothetical protein [Candidatus Brocadiales bacterium]
MLKANDNTTVIIILVVVGIFLLSDCAPAHGQEAPGPVEIVPSRTVEMTKVKIEKRKTAEENAMIEQTRIHLEATLQAGLAAGDSLKVKYAKLMLDELYKIKMNGGPVE